MSRLVLTLSLLLNVALLGILLYLVAYDPVVATITTPSGLLRTVLAGVVNRELAQRHGEEVQSDLVGRALIDLAAEESRLELDSAELEARWQDWLAEPGTRARLDSGEVTERELRDRLVTLVLLDQLSWNDLTPKEQDELLRQAYRTQKSEFEQLRLRHIVVESQKDALDVAQRLTAGVDFSELARRFSLDPLTREQGGDMGWKRRVDLTEELRAFLFLLPTGAASSPIASSSGWHIFLVEERRESFEECRDLIRREIMKRLRPDTLDGLRERYQVQRSDPEELLQKLKRPWFFEGRQNRAFDQPASGERPKASGTPLSPPSPSGPSSPLPSASPSSLPAGSRSLGPPVRRAPATIPRGNPEPTVDESPSPTP